MNVRRALISVAAAGAAGLAAWDLAGGAPATDALVYDTNCGIVDSNSAEGYVTNKSRVALQITGEVRFVFSAADSMSHPAIVYAANSVVPPGQTVRVGSVKLAFELFRGKRAGSTSSDAVRRAP